MDFKGYQPRVYKQIVGGYIPADAAIQLTGYMMIVSAGKAFNFKVDKSLLVVESKSGPDEKGSPLGIVEVEIHRKTWIKATKAKLDELREYEDNEETPPPACHSTRQRGFQTCPWSGICLEEVREIQRRESAAVATPTNSQLRFLKDAGLPIPEGLDVGSVDVALDLTRASNREIGRQHSMWAVFHSYAINVLARYETDLAAAQRAYKIPRRDTDKDTPPRAAIRSGS